ncbi:GNAT family N-acetyltransferase [Mycolicibacterium confluentis]|uniref:N-acetyltransferase n=1 Tax=Mycolicibacterium confluentis TaxID=28047 RepID=A0A7I7XZ90_9MYCO|nr:GNAT family N-acetyltransferase [Mycolicibacterium confluentis]MCV7317820.1 GNAT family N-acetyltransferase [Mycolicibacterium confluentis]ORV28127.1 acetyltransferase [Mycolicibacterium confluentis]BBZ34132.1 N-acetyltransferase [Mycolicibacterium confluentis]
MDQRVTVTAATDSDLDELAAVAAQTFPLACPPAVSHENVAAFIAQNLTADRFATYLRDPERAVLIATVDGRIVGYAMMIRGVPDDPVVQEAVTVRPAVELSKMYVLPDAHGSAVAAELMTAAVQRATEDGAAAVWLGVNQNNRRAQRFYAKHGFSVSGTKTFLLGTHLENDYVMLRVLA